MTEKTKTISVLVPCYNEEDNVVPLSQAVVALFANELKSYDYELLFIDNFSTDKTRELLSNLCKENTRIKAIFNANNFGQLNSPFYGLCQTTGDCTILLCCDFQDPIDMLPNFVKEWEAGYKIVYGVKSSSKENKLIYFLRSQYYKLVKKMSNVEQIEHFTGFGLYDKTFIGLLRTIDYNEPWLRGIVAEFGYKKKALKYTQQKRRAGKSKNNFFILYDLAMNSFTSYTKAGLRLATFIGLFFSLLSFLVAIAYLVLKLMFWDRFPAGNAPALIGIFFIGGIQLLFTGLLGEYILTINSRVTKRPLVVEEKRINIEEVTKTDEKIIQNKEEPLL